MPLTHTLSHPSLPEHALTQACFWDGDKLEQRKSFSQEWKVESASFCPGRGRFVVGGEDMYAHLYDYASGAELECNRGAQPAQHQRSGSTQCVCARDAGRSRGSGELGGSAHPLARSMKGTDASVNSA